MLTKPFFRCNKATYLPFATCIDAYREANCIPDAKERRSACADAVLDAADTFRAVVWFAEDAPASDVDTLLTLSVYGSAYCAQISAESFEDEDDPAVVFCHDSFLILKDLMTVADAANDLENRRNRWLNPMVNVDRLPAVVRALLYPNALTAEDAAGIRSALRVVLDSMRTAISSFIFSQDSEALHGFDVERVRVCFFLGCALYMAIPSKKDGVPFTDRDFTAAPF